MVKKGETFREGYRRGLLGLNRDPDGRFAPDVGLESTVELVGESGVEPAKDEVGYQPDGSKAFEERNRKSTESAGESRSLESDAAAFEREFGVRATEPDPWVKRPPDVSTPEPAPRPAPIKLGGVKESHLGTWSYPPSVGISTDEMAHFWATVKLHDSTISAIEVADRWGRSTEGARQHDAQLLNQLKKPLGWSSRQQRKDPEGYARDRALGESFKSRFKFERVQNHWGLIPNGEYRDVVRIGAYWAQIGFLDETRGGEPGRVLFEMSGGKKVTAPEIWNKYWLWEIEDAWFGRWKYVAGC